MNKAESTFWDIIKDRVGNPFILSAIIAFVFYYRLDLYELKYVDNFNNGKEIISRITPLSWGYLGELGIVLFFYYVSVLFGEFVSWLKHQLISCFKMIVEKKTYLGNEEQKQLIDKVADLKKQVNILESEKNVIIGKMKQKTEILFHILKFESKSGIEVEFTEIAKITDCHPFVFDTQQSQIAKIGVFDKLESFHKIIFKIYQHGNIDTPSIILKIPPKTNVSNMIIGNANLYSYLMDLRGHGDLESSKWVEDQAIFVSPTQKNWKVLKNEKPDYYIKITKANGQFTMTTKLS